jgi:RHS repeat-associated protein
VAGSGGTIYKFNIPQTNGYDPAGNLLSYTDCVPITTGAPCESSTWGPISYDNLNRLSGAQSTTGPWGGLTLGWTYDAYGNRTSQSATVAGPSPSAPVPPTKNWVYPSHNQATTLTYDPSNIGFVTGDGANQYAYDTEGRLCSVYNSTLTDYTEYVYDAEGRRVAKGMTNSPSCNPTANYTPQESYVLGESGEHITEQSGTGAFVRSHVYANGQLLATYVNNSTEFAFNDWLGSKRVVANSDGSVAGACINLPFGDELFCSANASLDGHHFTGQIHDSESGNDYFKSRYYSNNTGRFLSPDPSGLAFANPGNPQSLNLYSYVMNNPLTNIDPTGMECVWDDGSFDSEDDPVTGSSEGCTGQGGTYVPPNLFENAMLSNGQWQSSWGDWSSQANSNLAQNWLNPSSTTNATPDNSITLSVPPDVWNFAAQQTTPVSGPWTYGNWAGPGGMGVPVNDADAGAMMHDYCYHHGGFSASSNFGPPSSALQACNQALCDTESSISTGQGQNMGENVQGSNGMLERYAAKDMVDYFTNVPFKGNACKKR